MQSATQPSTLSVCLELLRGQRWMIAAFWLAMAAIFGIIGAILALVNDDIGSVWTGARWVPQYMILALGVITTSQHLRVYVAHGVSRRRFIAGAAGYGAAVSVLFATVMELGFVVERLIFHAGTAQQFGAGTYDVVASPLVALTTAAEFAVLYAAYFFAGWLIASCFYRLPVWGALALIIPTFLPVNLIEVIQWHSGLAADLVAVFGIPAITTPVYLVGGTLVVVIAGLLIGRLLRDVPVFPGPAANQ
jgi:hypothetical protein